MKKNYFISGALLLGAAAIISPAQAQEVGGWRNINHTLNNVSRSEGWSGVVTGASAGVGEIFAGAGMVYQVVRDLPAGEYTLTANAFYRDGAAPQAAIRHFDGGETKDGFLFINDTEVAVKSLFDKDGITRSSVLNGNDYIWEVLANDLGVAANEFAAGHYVNTVKAQHPGGDMIIGYKCVGKPNTLVAGKQIKGGDETEVWSAFTNFKLVNSANQEIALAGDGKFTDVNDNGWSVSNVENGNKGRGIQNGGVFSKTNASVYDHSVTTTEELPAGKYRFCMQSFNQHYLGAHPGYFIPMKGSWCVHDGKSAYDLYKENAAEYPMGAVSGDKIPNAGTVATEKIEAYLYAYTGEKILMRDYWDGDTKSNDWFNGYDMDGTHVDGAKDLRDVAFEKKVKNLFEEQHDEYLEVQNYKMANNEWKYVNGDGEPTWFESGHMREVAAYFIANPDAYLNTIEFELTTPSKVTVGYHKDVNQNNYAMPVFNFRLEYFDPTYKGNDITGGSAVNEIEAADANAPVEYYNLQGIRVANPENGLYIVKQGNKVTKRIIK